MPATAKGKRKKSGASVLLPLIMAAAVLFGCFKLPDISRRYIYPMEYGEIVEKYSQKYGVDENLVFAVIKTESNFKPDAVSDVGARGLMQLMEDAYEWVGYRMEDERELTYDHMFVPEYNIQYGTYLLMLLFSEYGDEKTAIAAYHCGRGKVNGWLKDPSLSENGKTLDNIPSSATNHYVNKVMRAYKAYNNLY